jgi:hypothetical protein
VPRAFESADELIELALATDKRRARLRREVDTEPRPRLYDLPDRNRVLLALRLDRGVPAELDRLRRRAVRRLSGEDAVRRRGGLQPGSGVDDITGGHPLPELRPRIELDQRLPGVDGDANLQRGFLDDPVANCESRAHGSLRIVLVCNRRAEERDHGVADELLDRPAPALQLVTQALVIRREHGLHVLGIEPLRLRREADEVGEENGDHFALGAAAGRVRRQRRCALGAELRSLLVLVAAARADAHPRSVRRAPRSIHLGKEKPSPSAKLIPTRRGAAWPDLVPVPSPTKQGHVLPPL